MTDQPQQPDPAPDPRAESGQTVPTPAPEHAPGPDAPSSPAAGAGQYGTPTQGYTDTTAPSAQASQPGPYGVPGQTTQPGQATQPGQPNQYAQPGQPGQYAQPGSPQGYAAPQPVAVSDARNLAIFAHLGGTFLSFLVPLIIYLLYKDRDVFVRRHSAQALNFHITLAIVYVVSVILIFLIIGIFTLIAAFIAALVFTIMASLAAHEGRDYQYPFTLNLVN